MQAIVYRILFCCSVFLVCSAQTESDEIFSLFTATKKTQRSSRLITAIQDCNVDVVQALVKLGEPLNLLDSSGYAPMHYAVFQNDPYLVRMLIHYGALPDIKTEKERLTPLHIATILNFDDVMEALVDSRANVNLVDKKKRSPLHYAAIYCYPLAVELLLEMRANPLLEDACGSTAFDYAFENDNQKIIDELIEARDADGTTLLHQAVMHDDVELVRDLLASGAEALVFDYSGQSPLDFARKQRNRNIISLLVAACDEDGLTLLGYAAKIGDVAEVRRLIEEGADIQAVDKNGNTPLLYAAAFDQLHVLHVLMMDGADAFVKNKQGNTLMHIAAEHGSLQIINWFMMDPTFNVDPRNNAGQTPLQLAALNGQFGAVNFLMSYDAYRYITDFNGNSVLHMAVQSNNPEVLIPLLRNAPLINAGNVAGMTSLHFAAQNANPDILAQLLLYKPSLDVINPKGQSPLHLAAQKGYEEQIKELLAFGASVNSRDFCGNTPLHYAAKNGFIRLIKPLLDCGAQVNARNNECQTPFDVACNNGQCEFADAIKDPQSLPDYYMCAYENGCRKKLI